jgi:hypothetical protein
VILSSLSQDHREKPQVRASSDDDADRVTRSSTGDRDLGVTSRPRSLFEPITQRESPGAADAVWDAAPWLDELREVPPEGVWPRFMTVPHPAAVGTYGPELVALFERMHPRRHLRWWQRLAAYRILEHDAEGLLVWGEYVGTISRQGGKSWLLRVLALWRLLYGGPRWGDEQLVLHTGKDVAILREVLKPAQVWAEANGLTVSRNNLEPGLSTGAHMTGNRWIIRAKDAVYGYAATNPLVDEGWAVAASIIDEGLEPTTVEQVSPQLGLWSTAHRRATGLMLERRAAALGELYTGAGGRLLLEWSTPEGFDRGDPAGWRRASPHWSPARERLVAKSYAKVLRGETLDPEEPDPIASFDAQWLNRWPDPVPLEQRLPDEPLLDPRGVLEAREAWRRCLDDAAVPDPGAALYLALEVDGEGAAAAAAALTPDGRVLMGGWRFPTRTEAVDWVQDTGEDAADPLLLVGASMVDDPELAGLEIATEPSGGVETRAALPLVRELVQTGRIAHDGSADTSAAVLGARVRPGVAATVMLLTGNESTALLRALLWAMRRAHLDRT